MNGRLIRKAFKRIFVFPVRRGSQRFRPDIANAELLLQRMIQRGIRLRRHHHRAEAPLRLLEVGQALAAYSRANPVLLCIGAVGTMLGAGVQVVCSRSLGRGSQEETNAGYSATVALTAVKKLSADVGIPADLKGILKE